MDARKSVVGLAVKWMKWNNQCQILKRHPIPCRLKCCHFSDTLHLMRAKSSLRKSAIQWTYYILPKVIKFRAVAALTRGAGTIYKLGYPTMDGRSAECFTISRQMLFWFGNECLKYAHKS